MDLIEDLPWTDLRQGYNALVAEGKHKREAAALVAAVVDRAVDWSDVVPGLAGQVLEAADGPLIRAAITIGLLHSRRGA